MRSLWRWLGVLAVILLFATAAAAAFPILAFELLAPHTAKRSTAALDDRLTRAVDGGLDRATIGTVDEARDFALSVTDKMLHFGLDHTTSMSFSMGDREGNCVEYASLFAKVFDRAATKKGLKARAFAVHSSKARVFGQKVPMRGWDDHDWVLIEDRTGEGEPRRLFVDPTLHDMGLGWDVSANVKGDVEIRR